MDNKIRFCHSCGIEIVYKTISGYYQAKRNNSRCKTCVKESFKGSGNPFYGKKHEKETIEKLSKIGKNRFLSDNALKALADGRKFRNENFKNTYDTWLKKYGKEEADKKYSEWKSKESLANSGSNNPMYGKPSPQGSGNGWSGWYLGHFFRSLIELSYMVEFLSVSGTVWESAETNKFKIEYADASGQIRNYFPDFLVNNKCLVEIKPKNLFKSENVRLKKEAAEKWCAENGYEYLLIEPLKLSNEKILELYNSGEIKFTERYEEKFEKLYKKVTNFE